MNNTEIENAKKKYPRGTRIRMIHMEDKRPIPPGTEGTVDFVDDMGTVHMKWENGRTLGIIPNEDEFEVIK